MIRLSRRAGVIGKRGISALLLPPNRKNPTPQPPACLSHH
jgi:hypothetical protein